jgi:2-polyprenyl-3-methyl-5-hydroxy-6-metoxy-1,4-benzoquinol methylase
MLISARPPQVRVKERAQLSRGQSGHAIYAMVAHALQSRSYVRGLFLDVGCGTGQLWSHVRDGFRGYVGIDAVRFDSFPAGLEFIEADLEGGALPLPDHYADTVAAVEVIEHLENPRAFVRELTRLVKPGGWVIVTTPNNLSALSLMTLIVKHRFSAFQDVHYPAHVNALLEIDLRRIATECGLLDIEVAYSHQGRLILTARHVPQFLSRLFPRACSDNLLLIGRKPHG